MERRDFAKKALLGAAGAGLLRSCCDASSPADERDPNVQPKHHDRTPTPPS